MITSKRIYIGIFAASVFACILFSFFRLTESPPFWYDEGWYFQTAANISNGSGDGIQLSPGNIQHISFLTVGYPLIYLLALWFKIFGVSVLSARTLMAFFILSFIIASFFLAKKLYKNYFALGALLLLMSLPTLYGNGKSVLGEVPGLFYMTVSLISTYIARHSIKNRNIFLILAGTFVGLCVVTKPLYILFIPSILVGLLVTRKSNTFTKKEILLCGTFLLFPVIVWLWVQFGVGDSFKSIFGFYANPYNKSQFILKVFTNIKELFHDIGTLYIICVVGIWTFSLLLRRKLRREIYLEEVISFVFATLTVLAFLRIGIVYRYLFPAEAIALIFLPKALFEIIDFLSTKIIKIKIHNASKKLTSIAILILVFAGMYQIGFKSWVAEAYTSKKTAFWEQYFVHVPTTTSVFFYDTPEVVPFIHHNNYYQFLLVPAGKTTGPEQLNIIRYDKVDKIIVETDKYEDSKSDLFKLYMSEEQTYKYSILKRRTKI